MRAEVRSATRADLAAYYGHDNIGPSVKAVVGVLDGKPVAIGGIAFKNGMVELFADIKDEARPYKHHLHRTALRLIKDALKEHKYVFAAADEKEPTAAKWLSRLGFKHMNKNLYVARRT
jgi:hypothetical protein